MKTKNTYFRETGTRLRFGSGIRHSQPKAVQFSNVRKMNTAGCREELFLLYKGVASLHRSELF